MFLKNLRGHCQSWRCREATEGFLQLFSRIKPRIFNNKIDDPNQPEARRNNYPLDSWPVGLRNIGNTCYLNSVLQFLFTIKPLRELILNCEDSMQDLAPEALKDKKVGRTAVTVERVVIAQKCQYNPFSDLTFD